MSCCTCCTELHSLCRVFFCVLWSICTYFFTRGMFGTWNLLLCACAMVDLSTVAKTLRVSHHCHCSNPGGSTKGGSEMSPYLEPRCVPAQKSKRAREKEHGGCCSEKFSKISVLLNLLCGLTTALTFENLCQLKEDMRSVCHTLVSEWQHLASGDRYQ